MAMDLSQLGKSSTTAKVGGIEIDYLKQQAQQNADYYATRLQNYLISYSNQIPQYLESVGNQTQIYPNMSNTYFGGINL